MYSDHDSFTAAFTFLASTAGQILSWTAGCEEATGITAAQATGRTLGDLFSTPENDGGIDLSMLAAGTQRATLRGGAGALRQVSLRATLHALGPQPLMVIDAMPVPAGHSAEDAFAAIVERLPCVFYVINRAGRLQYWNARLAQAAQRDASTLFGAPVLEFFDPHDTARLLSSMEQAFSSGESALEATVVGQRGLRTPFLFQCARLELGGQAQLVGTGVDISERARTIMQLRICERAMNASVNAIVIARRAGRDNLIEYVNPAFERVTGYSAAECMDRDSRFMRAGSLDAEERRRIREALSAGSSVASVLRNRRKNGEIFWNDLRIDPVRDDTGAVTHFVAIINDVTDSKNYEERLRHLATHDPLTGLANRAMLHDRLDVAVGRARRGGSAIALVYIDLDNFKYINDTFGHQGGDVVLRAMGERLGGAVRQSDTVARVGGDEFVVLINDTGGSEQIAEFIERMRHGLVAPLALSSGHVYPTVSIGVSLFPNDADTGDGLLRAADAAMYVAKGAGKNRYQFYSAAIDKAVHQYLDMEAHLRRAIAEGELTLRYQPKVDLASGRMVGAEALVRWNHPVNGLMLPDSFIAFAEECGLIVQLGEWVLRESCATIDTIRAAGFADFSLSVNLSARQLSQDGFCDTVRGILNSCTVGGGALELEVTESLLMQNPAQAARTLEELKTLGLRISIDDFGTGYSSLSYLNKFPFDFIKIDRSFLAKVSGSDDNAIITQAIIALGHNLHMRVIAEGVETAAQIDFLHKNHCDQIQGHYFSPAVASHTLLQYLESGRALH